MRILIPVDGSKCADAAVAEVASQKWPADSEARLVFALELFPQNLHGAPPLALERYAQLERIERDRAKNFLSAGASLLRRSDFGEEGVTTAVGVGSPKHVILDEAESWGADLIVMGSHGLGAVKRLLLGSVSNAVALHAPCSVRIVRSAT